MNRARINPVFARQERYQHRGEDNVDNHALDLYLKFREYRPHLKTRLERIYKDGRERELHEEVEDIKFYLSVMSDMLADENHGADAIQSFIDRIHEMIRKNPLNDMPSSSSSSNPSHDDEEGSAPRSPSPEVIDSLSDATSTARTIPLEREAPQFNHGRRSDESAKSAPPPASSPWDLPAYDPNTAYLRRGSYKDVDMRSDVVCQPIRNTTAAGRGSGVINTEYRSPWDTDVSRNDVFSGNRANMFGDSRQRDNRYNRPEPRDTNDWDDTNDWQNQPRNRNAFEPDVEYDRRNRNDLRDYGHGSSGRGASSSQDFSGYGGPNHPGFDRRSHDNQPNRGIEENMFDRRPPQSQFERREMPPPSGNREVNSSGVQFDYNHGGGGRSNGQSWTEDQTANVGANLNYPNPVINQPTFPNSYEIPQQQQQQQQMFLNHQMGYPMNTMGPPPQGVAGFMPGMNSAVPNTHMMGLNAVGGVMHHNAMGMNPGAGGVGQQATPVMGANSGIIQSPGTSMPVRAAVNFQLPQSVANNRPGLLPTPPVTSNVPPPNVNNFGFRNPNGPQHVRVPRPSVLTSPNASPPGSSSSATLSMSEISKQKAQQCFAQGRNQSSIPPRPRIATNQMVSERDPRLINRLNPSGSKNSSHGSHTSQASDASSSKRSLNDNADDRRGGSSSSSDRVPRDPRSHQRDDRSRDRDRGRDRDRDRGRESRDRDSRDRNTSSNADPRARNDRDGSSSSHKNREDVRGDKNTGLDPRQSKPGSSSQSDKTSDRNRTSEDASSSSRRDESRDRSSKTTEEDAHAKRLEEVRNRVRANMVQPKQVKPLVPDRLQEIRKQAAKEGYLTLGGKPVPGQKKQTNFEDAISSHKESTPTKANQKSGKKDGAKDKDAENSGGNSAQKKPANSKNKAKDTDEESAKATGKTKRRRIVVFDSDESDSERDQQKGKKAAKSKSKANKSPGSGSKADNKKSPDVPPKAPVFRIPKIKRPEPVQPPPPSPPSPVESASTDDGASSTTMGGGDLNAETAALLKAFVSKSVDPLEAENIINNPEALNEVFKRLTEQVRQIYAPGGSSNAVKSPTDLVPDESLEVSSESPVPEDAAESTEEPGSHRSRQMARKKNTKRRSSLEKLHDALREMGFDHREIGPRRCTRGPVEESTTEEATPQTAASENSEPADASIQGETEPNTTDVENETGAVATTAGGKRGRKRKRNTSVAKVTKKKKGPVTRAQIAVKTAISKSLEPKKKIGSTAGASNSGEGRVTRSRTGTIGRNSIVTNLGLGKVKVESDYVAPKEEPVEPEDFFTSESVPAGDVFQDMVDSTANETDLHRQVAPTSHVHLTMPSFSQDSDDVTGEVESNQGVHGNDGSQNDFQRRSVNPPIKKGTKRRVKDEFVSPQKSEEDFSYESYATAHQNVDTNYEEADLSFLPDLPQVMRVVSLAGNEENDTINTIYSKLNSSPEETEETVQVRSSRRSNSLDNENREDSVVPIVETQNIGDSSYIQSDLATLASLAVPVDPANEALSPVKGSDTSTLIQDSAFPETPTQTGSNYSPSVTPDDTEVTERNTPKIRDSEADYDYEIIALHDFYSPPSPIILTEEEAVLYDLAKVKGRVHLANDQEMKAIKAEQNTDASGRQDPDVLKTNESEDTSGIRAMTIAAEKTTTVATDESPATIDTNPESESSSSVPLIEPNELAEAKAEADDNLSDDSSGMALMERVRGDSTKVNLEGAKLYICANEPCRFTAVNGTLFKDHIQSCIFTPENKTVRCFHCDKRVKTIPHLLEHIKIHGHQKQFCSLCEFKTWMNSELTRHMKTHHKVYNFKLVNIDRGVDGDPDCVVLPKEAAAKTITLVQLQESYAKHADRLVFGPDDVDKLPMRQIFHTLAYCSLCSYSSKVRVNFVRHQLMHKNGQFNSSENLPTRDPVNPVPCLERQEMMFDKMTNWAGSSHAPKTVNGAADNNAVPQFVLEQFRYVCSEVGCGQITTDEYMLRTHMKTLHPETEKYSCPHCSKSEATRNDPRNSVLVDKLGNHLKLHGPKLYRCAHCDFINPLPTPMEKHLPDKHPEKKPIHYLIRNLDANGDSATRRSSVEDGGFSEKWRCSVCNSKTLFSTYEEAKNHCILMHRVAGQFVCADCRYSTDSDHLMKDHVTENCERQSSKEGNIFIMWIRTDYADMSKPDDSNIHGPIWKRTPQSVKHIRGIFLEESKEKTRSSNESSFNKGSETPKEPRKSAAKVEQLKEEEVNSPLTPFLMKCPKCNIYKTKNKKDMIVHLHNEMSYQRYRCTKCGHKFITENSLKGHVTGDHGIPYNQSLGELLPEDPEIEAFVAQCLEQDPNLGTDGLAGTDKSEGIFKCKHCPQEFQSGHNLRTHLLARHLASNMHTCKHCKQGFWNKKLAMSHHERNHKTLPMQIQHDIKLEQTFTPMFWLEEYGITVKEEKKIKRDKDDSTDDSESPVKPLHVRRPIHVYKPKQKPSNRRIVFCALCEYECDNPTDLENHMATHKTPEKDTPTSQRVLTPERLAGEGGSFDFAVDTLAPIRKEGELISVDPKRMGAGGEWVQSASTNLPTSGWSSPSSSSSRSTNPGAKNQTEPHSIYKCYHCKDNFLTVRATRTHWQKVHSRRPEERCNYYRFQATVAACGSMEKIHSCFVCEQGPFDFNDIVDHHITRHKEFPFRVKNQPYNNKIICEYCKVEHNRLEEMQQHMEEAHRNLPSKYFAIDLHAQDTSNLYDPFGKLIEDSVRFMCMTCKNDFTTREEHKEHLSSEHPLLTVGLTAGLRFQSHTLNTAIQIPGIQVPNSNNSVKYKCPVCEYVTADKEEMTSEHLTNHLYVYLCPRCPTSFQTVRDAKFHVRHSHGDPKIQPSVNEDAVAAFKLLEDVVEEVQISGVSTKSLTSELGQLAAFDTIFNNPAAALSSQQATKSPILKRKTSKDDEMTEDHAIGQASKIGDHRPIEPATNKNAERSVEAGPSTSSAKECFNTNVKGDVPPTSFSPKPVTSSTPGIPMSSAQEDDWMENFVNINPIAPELIEIPGVGSDQWGNIDLADYSGIAGEDPLISTGWGWEGKN